MAISALNRAVVPFFIHVKDSTGKSWYLNLNHIIYIDPAKLEIRVYTYPESTNIEVSKEELDKVILALPVAFR